MTPATSRVLDGLKSAALEWLSDVGSEWVGFDLTAVRIRNRRVSFAVISRPPRRSSLHGAQTAIPTQIIHEPISRSGTA